MKDALLRKVSASLQASGLDHKCRIAVGLSGGIDSVVLLHLLRRGLRISPQRLSAIHVNHQISVHAGSWAAQCRRYCRELGVRLKVAKVDVKRGNSTEAAARDARYGVFDSGGADVIALAHNRDDQAETVLLQLLRGAGPRGLAGMPFYRAGVPSLWRPLLDTPRSVIEAYARHHRLVWVEDDSNEDRTYLRNFVRHDVLPLIGCKVAGASAVLARAARLQAEASDLLDALAKQDIGGEVSDHGIDVSVLQQLPSHRARNALRYFLRCRDVTMPDAVRLEEALRQACDAREDARVCVNIGDVELRRFRGTLHIVRPLPPLKPGFEFAFRGTADVSLPRLGGVLRFESCVGEGIAAKWLRQPMTLRLRGGGEGLRLSVDGPRRTVRNLLQEAGLPPWQRERLPMLYLGDRLVAVPGLGVDEQFQPAARNRGWQPVWTCE
jgi:tRNA(Ile)-lysidine synthase